MSQSFVNNAIENEDEIHSYFSRHTNTQIDYETESKDEIVNNFILSETTMEAKFRVESHAKLRPQKRQHQSTKPDTLTSTESVLWGMIPFPKKDMLWPKLLS